MKDRDKQEPSQITQVTVLKTEVTTFNPFLNNREHTSDSRIVLDTLKTAYLREGKVFAGKVEEWVQIGVDASLEEQMLRNGFYELADYELISLEGEDFTPSGDFLNAFDGEPNEALIVG